MMAEIERFQQQLRRLLVAKLDLSNLADDRDAVASLRPELIAAATYLARQVEPRIPSEAEPPAIAALVDDMLATYERNRLERLALKRTDADRVCPPPIDGTADAEPSPGGIAVPDDTIISADTTRENRIPPKQVLTHKWPVLHAGAVPGFDPATWDFTLFPIPHVNKVKRFTWPQFRALPRVKVFADMHCVTRWSKLDNLWEGVPTTELRNHITIAANVTHVMVHSEYGFCTNLPIADFFGDDCLFAFSHNGADLTPDHGYPVRLVIPRLYAWKSAKWVRGVEFMTADRPGFWESRANGGYHMRGDPWTGGPEGDGQRFRES
jgi:DMSO/TMAO reductase YedYZ molybdopterin-dependent catalytic subunit